MEAGSFAYLRLKIVGEVNRPTVTQVGSANQLVADIRVSTYFQN